MCVHKGGKESLSSVELWRELKLRRKLEIAEIGKSIGMTDDKQVSRQRLKRWCAMALLECHKTVQVKDLQSVVIAVVDGSSAGPAGREWRGGS